MSSKWWFIVLLVATASPMQAFGFTEPAFSIQGEIHPEAPHRASFAATVSVHRRPLDVTVEIATSGLLLEPHRHLVALRLAPEVGEQAELLLEADPRAGRDAFGTVEVRVLAADGEVVAFESFGVGFSDHRDLILLPVGAVEHRVAELLAERAVVDARARARGLVASVLASGGRPVPASRVGTSSDPTVAPRADSQQAWDAEASDFDPSGESLLIPPEDDPCWPFIQSGNSSYQVRGQLAYRDDFDGTTRFAAAGYPVVVETQMRYQNACGSVMFRTHQYSTTTASNGWFSVQVSSHVAPGGPEPVVAFRATTPEAGTRSCGLTNCNFTPLRQSLTASQLGGVWEPTGRRIQPVFTAANSSHPFYFRWNDEIKSLRSRWAAAGFGSGAMAFRATYVPTANPPLHFSTLGDGIVVFDSANRWVVKWLMAHELGHHFQYTIQGNNLAGGGPHTICQAVSDAVGFVEGFADWHASWWEIEGRSLFFPCSGQECWSDCVPGYRREGNVMAFFWDLFDGANHATHDSGLDSVTLSLTLLTNWTGYSSFPAFYNDYSQRGLWGSKAVAVDTLRTVNRVTVAQ